MSKANFNCNMEDNNIIYMGDIDTMLATGREKDKQMIIDDVRRSDFTISFTDFSITDMPYSLALGCETIILKGQICYKGELVDSFECEYIDDMAESAILDECGNISYILVDRRFLEQVMCQYMNSVLSKVYGGGFDWRPESRVSKAFETLYCALCRDNGTSFLVYADNELELFEVDFDEAKDKWCPKEDGKKSKMVYIGNDKKCKKERLYF